MKLSVCSIFDSIDGEYNAFKGAGQLSTFIRLQGCNLRCTYCDTEQAQERASINKMEIDDILSHVNCSKVTITGGEPLLQKEGVIELCKRLTAKDIKVTIETNGSIAFGDDFQDLMEDDVRFVVDYKLTSSGENESMAKDMFADDLYEEDVIKFVIGSRDDYEEACKLVCANLFGWTAQIVFSPMLYKNNKTIEEHYDMAIAQDIVKWMLEDELNDVIFSLQIHKMIWWNKPIEEEY